MEERLQADEEAVQNICYIGAGHVGALSGIVMAWNNPRVRVAIVDQNKQLIQSWEEASSTMTLPIPEPGLYKLLSGARQNSNIHFSTNLQEEIDNAQMLFICVDTPLQVSSLGPTLDATNLWDVVGMITVASNSRRTIVVKSTVPLGQASSIRSRIRSDHSQASFTILSNPEFLAQGTAVQDLQNPDRVLIGWLLKNDDHCETEQYQSSVDRLVTLYSAWIPRERIITMNAWSAELAKLASNALLAQRVTNINTFAALCEGSTGQPNVCDITRAIGADTRLGSKSLEAGFGFGGPCLEKDLSYLVFLARSLGLDYVADYWNAVCIMNQKHISHVAAMIMDRVRNYSGIPHMVDSLEDVVHEDATFKITVVGVGFKKISTDTWGSPVVSFIKKFLDSSEFAVHIFDPRYADDIREERGDSITEDPEFPNQGPGLERLGYFSHSLAKACDGTHAMIINMTRDELEGRTDCNWEIISASMSAPKMLVCTAGERQLLDLTSKGFNVMRIGHKFTPNKSSCVSKCSDMWKLDAVKEALP